MKKYTIAGLIIVAGLAAAAYWWLNREVTLVDLQKQLLFAKTAADTARVIDRLEQYYLNLEVPDSIRQRVDRELAIILTTKINPAAYTNGMVADTNVYKLESHLQDLLQLAAIARVREENQTVQEIIGQAKIVAQTVDAGTQANYWVPFTEAASAFTKEDAIFWLKAKRSENLCRHFHGEENQFEVAELYASLGLKFLKHTKDLRVQLDILQRLQWILYFHRSMYELSWELAQRALPQTEKIKYHNRSIGLIYLQAETLADRGQNQDALRGYDAVINKAEQNKSIVTMEWFIITGLLGKGKVLVELGEFEEALAICEWVQTHRLPDKDKIRLCRLKSDIFRATVKFEEAEKELKNALPIAEATRDTFNLIMCLNSFGVLFERLGEYEAALDYYNQAKSLFRASGPDLSTRVRIMNNIADIMTAKNDSVQFQQMISEARSLARFASMPAREAELLRNFGNRYKKAGKYGTARKCFQEADSIFSRNGFLRLALGTRIDLVECLIGLSKFHEAKILASEIDLLAVELSDDERIIDARGLMTKINYIEGDNARAVESSNRLLLEIEAMSSRFNSADRLMAYRQRVYDHLKNAVFYEIAAQRFDSAFVKLDHAKGYALKSQLQAEPGSKSSHTVFRKHLNLDALLANVDENSLIIDYMVTQDTLYAFVVDQKGVQVLSKSIKLDELKKTVEAYKDFLNRTHHIMRHYDADKVRSHYAGTVELCQRLYEYLLGWPALQPRLQQVKFLYIVPDEFLFEVPFATLIAKASDWRTFIANQFTLITLPSAGFLHSRDSANFMDEFNVERVLISVDSQFPGAEEFVAKVKTMFPLVEELKVRDSTFTKDEVLVKLQEDYQVYIFVGHGSSNPKFPERSYLELSVKTPQPSTSKNVRLSFSDFEKIKRLDAKMVMLVGCETAAGKLYKGTGIWGLSQLFLLLGAQNVFGNLWEINASQALSQAQDFLASWLATRNSTLALRECQLKGIEKLQRHSYYKQPHPYFWGSPVLFTMEFQQ